MSQLVVLLAHGSPDARSSEAAVGLADRLQTRLDGATVRMAYLQHNWPTLTAAIGRELDSGNISSLHVQPLILSDANHAARDIPDALTRAERDHRMRIEIGRTIGMDPQLALALDRRIPKGLPVVLAWAGGRTHAAMAATDALVERWSSDSGRIIRSAIVSESGEAIVETVHELRSLTGRQAHVATFTLFPGVLADYIQAAAVRAETTSTAPLHTLPELVDLLDSRLRVHTA